MTPQEYIEQAREQLEAGIYDGDLDQFWLMEQIQSELATVKAENKRLKELLSRVERNENLI